MDKFTFDKYAKDYDEILQRQHRKYGDVSYYAEYKVRILSRLISNSEHINILEYGCGTGRNLEFLKKFIPNASIYATDISIESLNIAKQKHKDVIFYTLEEITNYSNYFDVVFIAGVYHHIKPEERPYYTSIIANLVKPNGKVLVFEHNPLNPITRKLVRECEFDRDAVLLGMSELIKLFEDAGFKKIKSGYTLFVPPKLKKFAFIEKYLSWLPFGGQYYVLFESERKY